MFNYFRVILPYCKEWWRWRESNPSFTQSIQDTAEFGVHIGVHQCKSKGALAPQILAAASLIVPLFKARALAPMLMQLLSKESVFCIVYWKTSAVFPLPDA